MTTLDLVRANTFWAEHVGVDPKDAKVPVVGGHAGVTIMPLLSQAVPAVDTSDDTLKVRTCPHAAPRVRHQTLTTGRSSSMGIVGLEV